MKMMMVMIDIINKRWNNNIVNNSNLVGRDNNRMFKWFYNS